MLSFTSYCLLIEETTVNKHSTHLEDLCIVKGSQGVDIALDSLQKIRDEFSISNKKSQLISTKYDGAPAVVAGWLGDKFFVSHKGVFSKDAKICFSDAEIDQKYNKKDGEGLRNKLKLALKYLVNVIPQGKCYQGDFLFDANSSETNGGRFEKIIDGTPCYCFHPNTILYTVEKDSDIGRDIGQAEIGIAFHTEYEIPDNNITQINKSSGKVQSYEFIVPKENPKAVWITDCFQKEFTGVMTFTTDENITYKKKIKIIERNKDKIDWGFIQNSQIEIMAFFNTYIKNDIKPNSLSKMFDDYNKYLLEKKQREIDKYKTQKSWDKVEEKYKLLLSVPNSIKRFFLIYIRLYELKMMFVEKLNKAKKIMGTYVKNKKGELIVTNDEGYVLTDTGASGCKLVDRYEFSKNNFSTDIVKGWEHPEDKTK